MHPGDVSLHTTIYLYDDISDCVEYESYVVSVGGASEVRVDLLLVLPLVQALELVLDVGRSIVVGVGTWKKLNVHCSDIM